MIRRVTLGKRFTQDERITMTDSWLSNGHWAIKKDRVANPTRSPAALLTTLGRSAEVVDGGTADAEMVRVCTPGRPDDERAAYDRAGWLWLEYDDKSKVIAEYVPFIGTQGRYAWVQRRYVETFDLEVLYGDPSEKHGIVRGVLCNEPRGKFAFAVMPCASTSRALLPQPPGLLE